MASGEREAIAAIDAQNDAWREAAHVRDLDAMMRVYAADAREMLPGAPALVGRAAIREFYANLIAEHPRFQHAFAPASVLVSASADLAVARGAYRFTPDADDPETVHVGKYVGVWRLDPDGWRLLLNISNSDGPA
jgi:uncharacterized protein (TIGR02246 family)